MGGEGNPIVSILVPTWNRVEMTVRAVRSVGSNRDDVEIVVVDNGSTEDLYSRLAEALTPFGNVRLSRNDRNLGMVRNWNRCIALASGTWMGLLCSDDEYLPDGIDRVCSLLRTLGEPSLVLQDPGIRSEMETAVAGSDTVKTLRLPIASGNFWHREATGALGGFDERFEYSADAEFWYRIASRFPVVKVRDPFARYHLHGENYMWATWEKNNFLEQTELLARTVIPYKLGEEARDREKVDRLVDEGLWRTLTSILLSTFLAKGRTGTFRRYFAVARRKATTGGRKARLLITLLLATALRIRETVAWEKTS